MEILEYCLIALKCIRCLQSLNMSFLCRPPCSGDAVAVLWRPRSTYGDMRDPYLRCQVHDEQAGLFVVCLFAGLLMCALLLHPVRLGHFGKGYSARGSSSGFSLKVEVLSDRPSHPPTQP